MNTVEDQLNGKGIELVSHRPDFLIALHGGTQTKENVAYGGYHYGPCWGGSCVVTSV